MNEEESTPTGNNPAMSDKPLMALVGSFAVLIANAISRKFGFEIDSTLLAGALGALVVYIFAQKNKSKQIAVAQIQKTATLEKAAIEAEVAKSPLAGAAAMNELLDLAKRGSSVPPAGP